MPDRSRMALESAGIGILRVVAGIVFVAHGWRKIMVGFDAVSQSFADLGIPAPLPAAFLVSFVELFGGVLLVVGFKTRLATIPLALTMLVAMFTAHWRHGFFLPEGFEYTLVLLAALITLGLVGPGAVSVDRLLRKKRTSGKPASEGMGGTDATSETIG